LQYQFNLSIMKKNFLILFILLITKLGFSQCPSGTGNNDVTLTSSCTINSTVTFNAGKTLTVPNGKTLTLSSGALLNTSSPTSAWGGIIVESGGVLLISDWATVQNALKGVTVKSGGTISAAKGKFINNRFDIWFEPDPNLSVTCALKEVVFEWNSDYYSSLFFPVQYTDPNDPNTQIPFPGTNYLPQANKENLAHVVIDQAFKVEFRGCIFSNKRNWLDWEAPGTDPDAVTNMTMQFQERGMGILANNAAFIVKNMEPCTYRYDDPSIDENCVPCNGKKNIFIGLGMGIVFDNFSVDENINLNARIDIIGADFINNLYGITSYEGKIFIPNTINFGFAGDFNKIAITQCRFVVDESIKYLTARKPGSKTNGIFLDGVDNFIINRNTFNFDYNTGITVGVCELDNPIPMVKGSAAITVRQSNNGISTNSNVVSNNFVYYDMEISCTYYAGGIIFINENPNVALNCNRIETGTHFGNPIMYDLGFLKESGSSSSFMTSIGTPGTSVQNRFAPITSCGANQIFNIGFSDGSSPTWFDAWSNTAPINYYYINSSWQNPSCNANAASNLSKILATTTNSCPITAKGCGFFNHVRTAPNMNYQYDPEISYPGSSVGLNPNPVSGTGTLTWNFTEMGTDFAPFTVTIVDLNGNIMPIPIGPQSAITGSTDIDLSSLPPGYYYLIINVNGYTWKILFIKY
jgi:hypothetical protein